MENTWIQLIMTGGTIMAGFFLTVRYAMQQISKRERALLVHTEKTQKTMLEYFETKNGHMERMAKKFTSSSNKMAKAIAELSREIGILSVKQK